MVLLIMGNQLPPAVLHVDLDGGRHVLRAHGWPERSGPDRLFATGLEHTLALLEQRGLRATLFVIAEDLDDPAKRDLLLEAVRRGHEIASHSVTHRRLGTLDPAERRRELVESRERLSAFAGRAVAGFRAPGFSLDRAVLEQVAEAGYGWDSSTFGGVRRPAHALPSGGPRPHRPLPDRPFLELPLPSYDGLPLPFHPSYSLCIGTWYFRRGLDRLGPNPAPFVMLLHLTDLADPLPSAELPNWRSRIFTLSFLSLPTKRARVSAMLDAVSRRYRWVETRDLVAAPTEPAAARPGVRS